MRYLVTPTSISLNYDGITKLIDKADEKYSKVLEAIRNKTLDKIPGIVDGLKNAIATSNCDCFKVENGMVYIDNTPVQGLIATRIVDYVKAGLDPVMLVNFYRNLKLNPSSRARERLFLFLENGNHPFTDDGCFIAYKKVREDMTDTQTGTISNAVGAKPSMNRADVDDDPEHTCSRGLHVASWSYAQGYSGTVLVDVKVNPKDVVSIPTDYNNQKMRVCDYEVIAISQGKREELHVSDNQPDMDDEDYDDDYDDASEDDYDDDGEDVNLDDINFDEDDASSPDFEQGIADAQALLTYFQSIGQNYQLKDFLKLKRFENKSHDYKQGVAKAAREVYLP